MTFKEDVLIIEDSPAITILLKNYLEKLGYENIHTCDSGSAAIQTFKELAEQKKQPIVLLDFMVPDMDARSIFTQILAIQPNARVILQTATEKTEEGVKELIRLGIYQYLEKPIRYENLKAVMDTIETEQSFFENKESPQGKEAEQLKMIQEGLQDALKHINFLIKSHSQITLEMIEQNLGHPDSRVQTYLQKLKDEGKISDIGLKKEIACNQCGSVKTTQTFFCPSCKASNFKSAKLIEHYDCGNISEENTYVDDLCPNCKKEIKALGVDYRVMKNHYICNQCKDFFSELFSEFMCLKCENRFDLESAQWKTSQNYKVINM